MPGPNDLRDNQRKEIRPLIEALKKAFQGKTRLRIAEESGLTNYQVGRILGDYLPAPTYLDIAKLIRISGMTPNEAAAIIGLYEDTPITPSTYERRIMRLLRSSKLTSADRLQLQQTIEAMVHGLEGHRLLEESAHDEEEA